MGKKTKNPKKANKKSANEWTEEHDKVLKDLAEEGALTTTTTPAQLAAKNPKFAEVYKAFKYGTIANKVKEARNQCLNDGKHAKCVSDVVSICSHVYL